MKIKLWAILFWKEVAEGFRGVGAAALLMRGLLYAALGTALVWFYLRFAAVYPKLGADEGARVFELLSLSLGVLFALMSLGAASWAVRSVRLAEDVRLFSALPVPPRVLLAAKLAAVYLRQLAVSAFTVPLFAYAAARPAWYLAVFTAVALPALSLALGALLAFPVHALLRFLRGKFLLSFLLGTALFGLGAYAYSLALGGAKELLLGGDLKYFFGGDVLRGISRAAKFFYPACLFARMLLGDRAVLWLSALSALVVLAFPLCFLLMGKLLKDALTIPPADAPPRHAAGMVQRPRAAALLGKEFVNVFRTPAYAFSYLSVAAVMPLMVFFCMSLGSGLIERVLGMDCSFELAVFLTLLYSALTNVFCATNVSREGRMFAVSKALPVSAWQVFAAKLALNMLVVAFSLFCSAAALCVSGALPIPEALAVFALGLVFSFAQVCAATRHDLAHPRFSAEANGEVGEGEGVSLLWIGLSLAVGGGLLALRSAAVLRFKSFPVLLSGLLAGGTCLAAAVLAALGLFWRLGRKYERFAGGGI